jgi:hypothetical protein
MITSHQVRTPTRSAEVREITRPSRRLEEHIIRALNKIKKPSAVAEITELLNGDLGAGIAHFRPEKLTRG